MVEIAVVETPLQALILGAFAGALGSLLLSLLARITPDPGKDPAEVPRNPGEIRLWQDRMRAPATARPRPDASAYGQPAVALTEPQSPGAEGLAQQFAFKVASGLFGRNISGSARAAGFAVHVAYGALWGALYGLLQSSFDLEPLAFGPVFGAVVWLVGPAALVPAMGISPPLRDEKPLEIAIMVAGHLAYGITVALGFEWLARIT